MKSKIKNKTKKKERGIMRHSMTHDHTKLLATTATAIIAINHI